MPANIVFEGVKAFENAITRMAERVEVETRAAVVEAGHTAQLAMQEKANTGRHAKGQPTSAAHGSGPNVVTGQLRRSIRTGPVENLGAFGWAIEIGPTAIYGRRVELEYDYPYTKPGLEEAIPAMYAIYQRHWRAALT